MSRHFRRLSLAQGVSLGIFGVLLGLALLIVAPRVKLFPLDALFILAAWFCFWFFSHDLTHHIVGRIVGVSFRYYFLGRSAITKMSLPIASNLLRAVPVLGLKIDKSSLNSISPNNVRAMYASGTVSSMLLPWVVVPTGYHGSSFLPATRLVFQSESCSQYSHWRTMSSLSISVPKQGTFIKLEWSEDRFLSRNPSWEYYSILAGEA